MTVLGRVRAMAARLYHSARQTGGSYYCPVCERRLRWFTPLSQGYLNEWKHYGFDHEVGDFEMLNAAQYGCPHCGATDRERLSAMYLRRRLVGLDKPIRLVEFAPSTAMRRMLHSLPSITYRTADLLRNDVDDRIDICDMPVYADESFDCFICSHVLEHVTDDRRAMRELRRIMKADGWGILFVPISLRLDDTREDPRAETEPERRRLFGQNDHVRLYARASYLTRLKAAGFEVEQIGIDDFGPAVFSRCGIAPGSVLDVVSRT